MWEKLMQPQALKWSEFTLVLSNSMLMTIIANLKLYTHESRMTSVAGFILATIRFIQRDLMVSTRLAHKSSFWARASAGSYHTRPENQANDFEKV